MEAGPTVIMPSGMLRAAAMALIASLVGAEAQLMFISLQPERGGVICLPCSDREGGEEEDEVGRVR